MIVDCPVMEPCRNKCSLGPFMKFYQTMKPHYSSVKIYALYLDEKHSEPMQKKALSLYSMKVAWQNLVSRL